MSHQRTAPRPWIGRALAAAMLAAAVIVPLAAAGPAAAASSANLILNGGGETGQCSPGGWDETTVPGWQLTSGDPVIDCYNATNSASTSTPGALGAAYFQGGSRGSSEMVQTVDVSSAATAIDTGRVSATLAGRLGGVGGYTDAATVNASYANASGVSLGSVQIGPVTPAQRGNTTELLSQSTTGTVPVGTRSIKVTVDFAMTGTQNDALVDGLSLTLNTAVTAPTLTVPVSTVPVFDHVFVVMMENNNFSVASNTADGGAGIIGNTSAPYINDTLLPMGALLTNYHAITHVSDPNYEAIAFGNAFGRSSNSNPGANCITNSACAATNNGLDYYLDAAGKSWKQYVQSQTSNCQTADSGNYESDDVPFYYDPKMQSNTSYCQAHWQPLPQLLNTDLASASTTPAFVWADADSCNDMEGCGVAAGDTWLSQTLPAIFNSPAWTTQKSLLVLTWDEDGNNGGGGFGPGQTNQVPTLVIGSPGTVKAGFEDAARYDHYSTAHVIEAALGLTTTMTGNDTWATPYNDVFTGTPGGFTAGTYQLTDTGDGMVMDMSGASKSAGGAAIQWPVDGGANQQWTFTRNSDSSYTVTNVASGLCLDVTGASTSPGALVEQWTCDGNANQRWLVADIGGAYTISPQNSMLSLAAPDTGQGSQLIQASPAGSALQEWTATPVG